MPFSNTTPESRRSFLRAGGRYLALSSLAALVIWQKAKSQRLAGDPNCVQLLSCRECVEFGNCSKPQKITI